PLAHLHTPTSTRRLTAWLNPRPRLELLEARDVPATFYVDDNFATPVPGLDPDGAGPATVFGTDSFSSIQAAVTAAGDGDTVFITGGTYRESNIQVDADSTLQGQSQAGVIISPDVPDVNEDSSFTSGTSGEMITPAWDWPWRVLSASTWMFDSRYVPPVMKTVSPSPAAVTAAWMLENESVPKTVAGPAPSGSRPGTGVAKLSST